MAPTSPLFTILLAVHRPPVCLPFAIESVLAQTVESFELLVVCDGAPAETVACAEEFAQRDKRIGVLPFPKGERNGEAYWHLALQGARGRYVVHIEDDDLWFPNHLEEMEKLLATVDFGHLIHSYLRPSDGGIVAITSDIGLASYRQRFLDEMYNRFGFTFVGYRLSAYRRLPEGWAPSPPGFWPDLWMWRKFFRMPDFRFGTRAVITAISITAHLRDHDVSQGRSSESRLWLDRILDPVQRSEIIEAAWHFVVDEGIESWLYAHGLEPALHNLRMQLEQKTAEHRRIADELAATQALVVGMQTALDPTHSNLACAEADIASLVDGLHSTSDLHRAAADNAAHPAVSQQQAGELDTLRHQIEKVVSDLEIVKHGVENWLLPTIARHSAQLGRRGKWLRKLQRAVRAKPSPGV